MANHILDRLYEILQERKSADPDISYVAKLYNDGTGKCAQKFGEEAVETVIEAMKIESGDKLARAAFAEEAADAVFHLMVLCTKLEIEPDLIWAVLEKRFGQTGIRSGPVHH